MTRTPALAALTTTAILLLGACGSSDEPEASDPTSAATPTSAAPTPAQTTAATTPAPTASTTAPTTAPTGNLISYETEDGGVMITKASDTAQLKGAPSDFKTFIARELASATPEEGCTEKPQISVDRLDTGGWARGGHFTPQCGGYATLWAKANGGWKAVWSGQSLVECTTLASYRFPARVAGKQCLDGDNAVTYSG